MRVISLRGNGFDACTLFMTSLAPSILYIISLSSLWLPWVHVLVTLRQKPRLDLHPMGANQLSTNALFTCKMFTEHPPPLIPINLFLKFLTILRTRCLRWWMSISCKIGRLGYLTKVTPWEAQQIPSFYCSILENKGNYCWHDWGTSTIDLRHPRSSTNHPQATHMYPCLASYLWSVFLGSHKTNGKLKGWPRPPQCPKHCPPWWICQRSRLLSSSVMMTRFNKFIF